MPKRSEVERVAQQIGMCLYGPESRGPWETVPEDSKRRLRVVAEWHLREVRRARGKTVGWCQYEPRTAKDRLVTPNRWEGQNCRVVLAPRRKGAK